jgi:hypothetical protein
MIDLPIVESVTLPLIKVGFLVGGSGVIPREKKERKTTKRVNLRIRYLLRYLVSMLASFIPEFKQSLIKECRYNPLLH